MAKADSNTKKDIKRRRSKVPWQEVIDLWMSGKSTDEIAIKTGSTPKAVDVCINSHIKKINNLRETQLLVAGQKAPVNKKNSQKGLANIKSVGTINDQFISKLSTDPNSDVLTDEESLFCHVFALTGDGNMAVQESGLDIALLPSEKKNKNMCIKLRVRYLLSRPNIKKFVQTLRADKWVQQARSVDKVFIQSELLELLDQMKFNPDARYSDINSTLKLLGQTVGAYIETIQVSEIDPKEALGDLIEMVKEGDEDPEKEQQGGTP